MKIFGLRTKIITLLIVLITGVMGWMTYQTIQVQVDNRIQEFTEQARAVGTVFGYNYARSLLTETALSSQEQLSTRLWEKSTDRAVFFMAYGVDGKKLHQQPDTIDSRFQPLPELPKKNIRHLLKSDKNSLRRWNREQNLFEVLVPIRHKGNQIGIIRMGLDTREIEQARNAIFAQNLRVTGYFWIAVALIGMIATGRITNPLENLVDVTRKFGQGNLEARTEVNTRDEIGELSDRFNEMADRIQRRIREREQSLAQLEAIQRVGTTLNESTDPDVFFPVLDEAIQTLYGIEAFTALIREGDIYYSPYSRPELENPLFLSPESDAIQAVGGQAEPHAIQPDEDWNPALRSMTWAYPLKTGDYLNGVLYMDLHETPGAEELEWMQIWGTQVSQAIRGMVLNHQIVELQNQPVQAMTEGIEWLFGQNLDQFGQLLIPNFFDTRQQEGLFYGEDFYEQLTDALKDRELKIKIMQIQPHQFLLAGDNLSSIEKNDIVKYFEESVDFEFIVNWYDNPEPTLEELEQFLLEDE